jgi:hypothetical protein
MYLILAQLIISSAEKVAKKGALEKIVLITEWLNPFPNDKFWMLPN